MARTLSRIGDRLTATVKRAIDILFVQNPFGTSLGAAAGVIINGLVQLVGPSLRRYGQFLNLNAVTMPFCIAIGIFVFNLPRALRRHRVLPAEIEEAFEAIDRMRGTLTDTQLRMQYLALCASVLNRARRQTNVDGPSPA